MDNASRGMWPAESSQQYRALPAGNSCAALDVLINIQYVFPDYQVQLQKPGRVCLIRLV